MKVKTIIKGKINFSGDYYCTLCMGTVYLKYFGWSSNLFDLLDFWILLEFFKKFLNTLFTFFQKICRKNGTYTLYQNTQPQAERLYIWKLKYDLGDWNPYKTIKTEWVNSFN